MSSHRCQAIGASGDPRRAVLPPLAVIVSRAVSGVLRREEETNERELQPLASTVCFLPRRINGTCVRVDLAPSRVAAQGTPEQRAACEEEAKYLCANYIPDEQQITACMVRNVHSLSPQCRAMFETKKKPRKHK